MKKFIIGVLVLIGIANASFTITMSSASAVTVSSTGAVAVDTSRQGVEVQNISGEEIHMGFGASANITTSYVLVDNAVWSDKDMLQPYVGLIEIISVTTANKKVIVLEYYKN